MEIKEQSRVKSNRGNGTVQRIFSLCNGAQAAKVAWDDGTVSPIAVEFLKPLTAQDAVQDIQADIQTLLQKIGDAGVSYDEIHHHGFAAMCGTAASLEDVVKDVLISLSGATGRQE